MTKKLIFIYSLFVLLIVGQACSKDEASPSGSGSRDIKYEITGDFTGKFIAVATTNTDQFEVIEITKLPWKLEFTAKKEVSSVLIIASGTDGKAGEKATLKTFVGGKEVSSGGGTAISFGALSLSTKQYFLK